MSATRVFTPALAALVLATPIAAQTIHGHVVDPMGAPVAHASVMLVAAGADSILTGMVANANGEYTLHAPRAGRYDLVAQIIGYETARQPVRFNASGTETAEIRLRQTSVQLTEIEVTATRDMRASPAASGLPVVLDGAIMASLERRGNSTLETVTNDLGAATRTVDGEPCFEYPHAGDATQTCRQLLVVINNVVRTDGTAALRQLRLTNIESIELLPPATAIRQYAAHQAGYGAIVIWSRGRGPHVKATRGNR